MNSFIFRELILDLNERRAIFREINQNIFGPCQDHECFWSKPTDRNGLVKNGENFLRETIPELLAAVTSEDLTISTNFERMADLVLFTLHLAFKDPKKFRLHGTKHGRREIHDGKTIYLTTFNSTKTLQRIDPRNYSKNLRRTRHYMANLEHHEHSYSSNDILKIEKSLRRMFSGADAHS